MVASGCVLPGAGMIGDRNPGSVREYFGVRLPTGPGEAYIGQREIIPFTGLTENDRNGRHHELIYISFNAEDPGPGIDLFQKI